MDYSATIASQERYCQLRREQARVVFREEAERLERRLFGPKAELNAPADAAR